MSVNLQTEICEAFRRTGLSMKAFSDRSKIPYSAVHGLLTGRSDTKLSTASKACELLGLRLAGHRERRAKR